MGTRSHNEPQPGSWRDIIRPQVRAIVQRVGHDDAKKLRAALRVGYPYGERRYWPYKVWREECRLAMYGRGARLFDRKTIDMFDARR